MADLINRLTDLSAMTSGMSNSLTE